VAKASQSQNLAEREKYLRVRMRMRPNFFSSFCPILYKMVLSRCYRIIFIFFHLKDEKIDSDDDFFPERQC
jgi:hypothetical protein